MAVNVTTCTRPAIKTSRKKAENNPLDLIHVMRLRLNMPFEKPTAPVVKDVEIPANIVVSDLAQKLAIRATDIIKAMMKMGMMVTINQTIDQDTAILVTEELGHKAKPMQEMTTPFYWRRLWVKKNMRLRHVQIRCNHYGSR